MPTSRTFKSLITACRGENLLQKMYTTSPRFLPDTADLVCALLQACAETTALGCAFELTSYLERSIGSDGDAKERRNLKATLCKSLGAIKHLLGACIAVGNLDLHATLQSKLAVLGVPLQKMPSSAMLRFLSAPRASMFHLCRRASMESHSLTTTWLSLQSPSSRSLSPRRHMTGQPTTTRRAEKRASVPLWVGQISMECWIHVSKWG